MSVGEVVWVDKRDDDPAVFLHGPIGSCLATLSTGLTWQLGRRDVAVVATLARLLHTLPVIQSSRPRLCCTGIPSHSFCSVSMGPRGWNLPTLYGMQGVVGEMVRNTLEWLEDPQRHFPSLKWEYFEPKTLFLMLIEAAALIDNFALVAGLQKTAEGKIRSGTMLAVSDTECDHAVEVGTFLGAIESRSLSIFKRHLKTVFDPARTGGVRTPRNLPGNALALAVTHNDPTMVLRLLEHPIPRIRIDFLHHVFPAMKNISNGVDPEGNMMRLLLSSIIDREQSKDSTTASWTDEWTTASTDAKQVLKQIDDQEDCKIFTLACRAGSVTAIRILQEYDLVEPLPENIAFDEWRASLQLNPRLSVNEEGLKEIYGWLRNGGG